ncbi:hypothetical protein F4782DRAFT_545632 [Xylaria castorea]|nr:hypothetical protein F4782DRAFT_545632 [Xylaria castorea]
MDFKSATTRLRRTFAYPSDTTTTSPSSSQHLSDLDDSDSDLGPALDEQEQEELIQSLTRQNARRNAQFRLFLLSLPALSAIPYFLVLFAGLAGLISGEGGRGRGRGRGGRSGSAAAAADIWIALLALSSLASTAWTLWSLPPGVTGIRFLDAWVGSSSSSSSSDNNNAASTTTTAAGGRGGGGGGLLGPMGANARRRRRASAGSHSFFWAARHHRSPLEQFLPFLNVALCGLLILAGFLSSSSQRSVAHRHWGHVGLANLPALIYVVVLVAKMLMGSIDPERELSALRYEYKGA